MTRTSKARARFYTVADLKMERVEKLTGPLTIVVCGAALLVSYAQIRWAAEIIGLPYAMTWLFPLLIDVPALVASGLTVSLHGAALRLRVYAWSVLITFLALSWFCNGLHAVATMDTDRLPEGLQSSGTLIVWALSAIPPIGAVLGPHLYSTVLRTGVRANELSTESGLQADAPLLERARPAAPVGARVPARPATAARVDAPTPARPAEQAVSEARAADAPQAGTRRSIPQDAFEAGYAAYAAARDAGHRMMGPEIAKLLGIDEGHARNVRNKKWDPRYDAERAIATEAAEPPAEKDATQAA